MNNNENKCRWCHDPAPVGEQFCDQMCAVLHQKSKGYGREDTALRVPRLRGQSERTYHGDNYNG